MAFLVRNQLLPLNQDCTQESKNASSFFYFFLLKNNFNHRWAGPPTVFYLMHKLIEDPVTRNELLAQIDWLIVPMQNPDGYVILN